MSNAMRGVDTNLTKIRRTVFKEVARIAYQGGVDVDGDGIEGGGPRAEGGELALCGYNHALLWPRYHVRSSG